MVQNTLKITAVILAVLLWLSAIGIGFFFYGPYHGVRDVWITTAMRTMNHKYLATTFFDEELISSVMEDNTVQEFENTVDMSLINTDGKEDKKVDGIPEETESEIIDISANGYRGWLVKIKDPGTVKLEITDKLWEAGENLESMVVRDDYKIGINAGGFMDAGGYGNGGTPYGIVIKDGQSYTEISDTTMYEAIGFTKDNILVTERMSGEKVKQMDFRDAVEFGPVLIRNGEPAIIRGDGGWGIQPRTAIGQTATGEVLFLVIDGRKATSVGASLKTVMDILAEHGAINAANLDGGASTTLFYEHSIWNSPAWNTRDKTTRPIATAFVVERGNNISEILE